MPIPTTNERVVTNRRLLRDDVHDRLMEAIVNGTLEPGERLRDEELAEWMGVSRTPIREAITRLVDMGLVEMEPNRFTRVAPIDLDLYVSAQQIMGALRHLAADLAVPHFVDDDVTYLKSIIKKVRQAPKPSEGPDALVYSWAFAMHFVNRSGNAVLAHIMHEINPGIRRASRYLWPLTDNEKFLSYVDELEDALEHRPEELGRIMEVRTNDLASSTANAAREEWNMGKVTAPPVPTNSLPV